MFLTAIKSFVAGVVATLVFHQAAVWLLHTYAGVPFKPWNMQINAYGVPGVLALAFWAGIWAIPMCGLIAARPRLPALLTGLVFGALLPSLWGFTVLAAMRGTPMFAGGDLKIIGIVLLINGIWGLATVVLFNLMYTRKVQRRGILA